LAPHQTRPAAVLGDRRDEAADHRPPGPLAQARQMRVVGQRFSPVVAEVPAQAEAGRVGT
jgi:hypothetical protein